MALEISGIFYNNLKFTAAARHGTRHRIKNGEIVLPTVSDELVAINMTQRPIMGLFTVLFKHEAFLIRLCCEQVLLYIGTKRNSPCQNPLTFLGELLDWHLFQWRKRFFHVW